MAVANWFLERGWREAVVSWCDQMKLNKLAYFSHAWYMGNCHVELFPEDVEAWPHGPVIRSLYVEFHDAGRDPITRLGTRLEIKNDEVTFVTPKHDGSLDDFFESIWGVYGQYTGIQLSNMTHDPGEPWTIVAEQYGYDLKAKPTIPSEIIESVYRHKVESVEQGH